MNTRQCYVLLWNHQKLCRPAELVLLRNHQQYIYDILIDNTAYKQVSFTYSQTERVERKYYGAFSPQRVTGMKGELSRHLGAPLTGEAKGGKTSWIQDLTWGSKTFHYTFEVNNDCRKTQNQHERIL